MKVTLDNLERYGNDLNAIADESSRVFELSMRMRVSEMEAQFGDISSWSRRQINDLRDYATDLMVDTWSAYGDASSSIGSMFFEEVLGDEMPEQAMMADYVSVERAEASARHWAKNLFGDDADVEKFIDGCSSFVNRQVSHSADMKVMDGARELASKGKRVKYGRVPVGPTCGFCIMLASRGFVYASKRSAGDAGGPFNRFHDRCNCRVVAGYEGLEVEGYDYKGMYARYMQCRSAIGDTEQLQKDWDAITPEERNQYGRGERAIPLSEDPKEDARLRDKLGAQADGFNDYVEHRIVQEMNTRDREWLYSGKIPIFKAEQGAEPDEFEKEVGKLLREKNGFDVEFRKRSLLNRDRKADTIIGDEKYEIKNPTGTGGLTVHNQIKKNLYGSGKEKVLNPQSDKVVISNVRSEHEFEELVRQAREVLSGDTGFNDEELGEISEIIVIDRSGKIIRLKKESCKVVPDQRRAR